MTPSSSPSKALVVAAFAALYIIWGSTYLGILYAIESIPPLLMAGARFVTAGVLLLGWLLARGEKLPSPRSFGSVAVGGILMLFAGNGALAWAEQFLPSGLAAIIVASVPLWFILLDRGQWAHNFRNKKVVLGLLIGFVGVMLLFAGKGSSNDLYGPGKMVAVLVLMVGTIGWAAGSLYSKYVSADCSTAMKAAIQMLAAGLVSLAASGITGEAAHFRLENVTTASIWALLYLIFFGSFVGYMSYIWLLSVRPAAQVGTYAYVNPVVAVFLGWLFAGEPIGYQKVLALAVILGGVLLVNLQKKTESPQPEKGEKKREVRKKEPTAAGKT
ncbi:EamA family transporter [Paraflavisolibacter sp. H34]|uniref:EamA family transporter n=1 Tax=Huijunlia imazamoxiresistens TaxID=3127457 RepID=UPI00301AE738